MTMKSMFSRTVWLVAVSLLSALALGCASRDDAETRTRYVLVHGAWMGAWCWDDVTNGLRDQGAVVSVVELPAHGADQTPWAGATMDAYVAKVRAAVEAAEVPVVLVGHSMGGMVVTAVAEQIPAKVAKLVYLGAYLPQDGQSLFDLASTDVESHLGPALAVDQMLGMAGVPVDKLADIFIADGSAAEIATVISHYRDEPLAPFVTPVHTSAENWGTVAKFYLYTRQDHALSYARQQQMTVGLTLAGTATLDTSHAPFLSQPEQVVAALSAL